MNLMKLLRLMRPHQWLKNLMIFFPPLLSGLSWSSVALKGVATPFLAFSFASSAAYVINDLIDCKKDKLHPVKCRRPLPSGEIGQGAAIALALVLLVVSVLLANNISTRFLFFLLSYFSVAFIYSLWLKNWPLLDIFCISFGFVFRLYAGGEAFKVDISDWLFLSVFMLAVFLSIGKRYSELQSLGDYAIEHRPVLRSYPEGFLEGSLYMSGAAVIVVYAIYAISRPLLVYTVPFCMFGLLRFILRVKSGKSGDPTEALVKDVPLCAVSAAWLILVIWCIYQ